MSTFSSMSSDQSLSPVREKSLRQFWIGLGILYSLLLLHFLFYRFVNNRCTAPSCTLSFTFSIFGGLSVIAVALLIPHSIIWKALRRLPSVVFLLTFAALQIFVGANARPEWIYPHLALSQAALGFLLYVTLFGIRVSAKTEFVLLLCIGLAVIAIWGIRILSLASNPSIQLVDEGWTMGWAVSYLKTGYPSDWIMGGVSGIPHYSLPRYYALVAAWFSVVGVGLWQGRLFSLLLSVGMILLTTMTARNLFGRFAAFGTLITMAVSSLLVVGFRLRHDIGAGFCLAAALYIYSLAIHQTRFHLHLLAGLVSALGMFAHYHATGFTIALGIGLYTPTLITSLQQKKLRLLTPAIAFAVGSIISGFLVIVVQMLPDLDQVRLYTTPRTTQSIGEFIESFVYHIVQIAQHSQFEFLLLVIAFIAGVWHRQTLAITLGLSYLSLAAFASWHYGPFDYYSVPLLPVLALLVGQLLITAPATESNAVSNSLPLVACVCFLAVQVGITGTDSVSAVRSGISIYKVPNTTVQWVLDNVPATEKILADNYYFLWLYQYPYLSPMTPEYMPSIRKIFPSPLTTSKRTETLINAWDILSPDVIIIDPNLATSGYLIELQRLEYPEKHGYQQVFTENITGREPINVYWRK